ncbi:MAG TPA: MCE family protein, partial [Nocardioides sp.]
AVANKNLGGKGKKGNDAIRSLSEAAETFGDGSGDLFSTVKHLAEFTDTLATNDELVVAFMKDLTGVTADLAEERDELEAALTEVAGAIGTVESFVEDNREALSTDVEKLTRVIKNIASEKDSMDLALTAGPVGIGNLVLAFDDKSGAIGSRFGFQGNVADADGFLCAIVQQSELPKAAKDLACTLFESALEPIVSQANQASQKLPMSGGTASETSREDLSSAYASGTGSELSDLLGAR